MASKRPARTAFSREDPVPAQKSRRADARTRTGDGPLTGRFSNDQDLLRGASGSEAREREPRCQRGVVESKRDLDIPKPASLWLRDALAHGMWVVDELPSSAAQLGTALAGSLRATPSSVGLAGALRVSVSCRASSWTRLIRLVPPTAPRRGAQRGARQAPWGARPRFPLRPEVRAARPSRAR